MRFLKSFLGVVLVIILIDGCGGGSGGDGSAPADGGGGTTVLASATIGSSGGTVEVTDSGSPYYGTKIEIPSGALSTDTNITINKSSDAELPSDVYIFDFGPDGQTFNYPVTITIKYSEDYLSDFGITDETELVIVSKNSSSIEVLTTTSIDTINNTITALANHFTDFRVISLPKYHHDLFLLPNRLTTQVNYKIKGSVYVIDDNGSSSVSVGKGSVNNFFGSSNNVMLIHGFTKSPLTFIGANDLLGSDGLINYYENIVSYMYPSGKYIATNANWLYNEIKANAQAGFKTSIIAHSMGGLVARYMIERSPTDTSRPGYQDGDPSLAQYIDKLIMVGTPNTGAPLADIFSATLNNIIFPVMANSIDLSGVLIPGLRDLTTLGIGHTLNSSYVDNTVEYYLVAGDIYPSDLSKNTDLMVPVSSVNSIPLTSPEEGKIFPPAGNAGFTFDHEKLHTEAAQNGILAQIITWLGKDAPTAFVQTPSGVQLGLVSVSYTLVDPQSDVASINVSYSTNDGSSWSIATEGAGSDGTVGLATSASGTSHVFVWNSVADNVGTPIPSPTVSIRITPSDGVAGTIDITNNFEVNNTGTGGTWQIETVNTGSMSSIAIDSNNKIHISSISTFSNLRYTTNSSGSWVTTMIDSGGGEPSIILDSTGKVHISYRDTTNYDLKYATNASGSWVTTTIDSLGDVGAYTSIAVDSANKVHISYCDWTNKTHKYATNASGSWVTTTIDSSATINSGGGYSSIILDSTGKVHISYYDATNSDLKYTTNASGYWSATTVDSTGAVGWGGISIALDSANKVHISYFDDTNNSLKYATNSGGSWTTATIDSTGIVGLTSSIAIDSTDKVHISYGDESNADLKYITNKSGSWIATTVDSLGRVGRSTSIVVDSLNKAHITYNDFTNGTVKYAKQQ